MNKAKADDELFELSLANLFPTYASGGFPTEHVHEKTLAAAKKEVITLLRSAHGRFKDIEDSKDYTDEAKKRLRADLASEYIGKLDNSATYNRATEACEYILQRYEAQITSKLPKVSDPQAVGIASQIRDRLSNKQDERERMSFLEKNGNDPVLIAACLAAPRYLTNLTDGEAALLRANLEKHADPKIVEGRSIVNSALSELERGVRAARSRLAKLGNVPDGSFGTPAWRKDTTARPAGQGMKQPSTAPSWR